MRWVEEDYHDLDRRPERIACGVKGEGREGKKMGRARKDWRYGVP